VADNAADKTTTPNAELKAWAGAWLSSRDETAARRLMDALYPGVIAIIRARRSRRMAEEDLAQEVFVRFFERLASWDGRAPLSHWISRIAVNQCIDQLRAEGRRPELRLADLGEEEAQALEACLEAPEALADHQAGANELILKLLAALKPEERAVIEMLDLEGRTATEVEALTGWSSVAIRVRALRARRKLRKLIERLEKTHEDPK
jgi:RNA polymerase sigma-70 factor (ECF subfamily)